MHINHAVFVDHDAVDELLTDRLLFFVGHMGPGGFQSAEDCFCLFHFSCDALLFFLTGDLVLQVFDPGTKGLDLLQKNLVIVILQIIQPGQLSFGFLQIPCQRLGGIDVGGRLFRVIVSQIGHAEQLRNHRVFHIRCPEAFAVAGFTLDQRRLGLLGGIAYQFAISVFVPLLIADFGAAFPADQQTGEQVIGFCPVGAALFQFILRLQPAFRRDDGFVLALVFFSQMYDAAGERFSLQNIGDALVAAEAEMVGDLLRRHFFLDVQPEYFFDFFRFFR